MMFNRFLGVFRLLSVQPRTLVHPMGTYQAIFSSRTIIDVNTLLQRAHHLHTSARTSQSTPENQGETTRGKNSESEMANLPDSSSTTKQDPSTDLTQGRYRIFFTCKVCKTRGQKEFSKQAYHKGVVVIRCDNCEKLHLIADNMGWFGDTSRNIETILAEKGEKIRKDRQKFEITTEQT